MGDVLQLKKLEVFELPSCGVFGISSRVNTPYGGTHTEIELRFRVIAEVPANISVYARNPSRVLSAQFFDFREHGEVMFQAFTDGLEYAHIQYISRGEGDEVMCILADLSSIDLYGEFPNICTWRGQMKGKWRPFDTNNRAS